MIKFIYSKTGITVSLLTILLLALCLRVYQLNSVPVSLFGDEIDVGYQAYSLLNTGRDLSGRFLPVYLKSLSEFRASLFIYSAMPFVASFGLNEWGIRLSSAVWGVLGVFGTFLLGSKMFSKKVGIIGALLLAISPWHLQYSRAAFEVTMLLSFIIFGTYFFLLKKSWSLIISAILFGLTVYIYSTAVVFGPMLLAILVFIYKKELFEVKKIYLVAAFGVLILVILPMLWFSLGGEASARFSTVSIFQDSVLLDKINLARKSQSYFRPTGESLENDPKIESIFHNKSTVYTQVFLTNYLKALSFNFLFAEGDINFRHSIHEMGELYYVEIILFLLGCYFLYKYADYKEKLLVSGWLLIAPIPGSLTADGGYHATRLILMLPPLILINSLGLNYLINHLSSKYFKLVLLSVSIIFLVNITFYIHRYYVHYPVESWRWWHVGYKEAMLYMKSEQGNYQKLVFNNTYEPTLIRFLMWWQYPPEKIQSQIARLNSKDDVLPGFNGFSVDNKYYFGQTKKYKGVIEFVKPGMLYLVSQRDDVEGDWDWRTSPPGGIKVLKTVVDPTNTPIFYVVTAN